MLKPQDILVVLKLLSVGDDPWSQGGIAYELGMSASEVNASLKRTAKAGLLKRPEKSKRYHLIKPAIEEFIVHGLKYVFPEKVGEPTRGIPTSYAAPPLNKRFAKQSDLPPVWPDPEGKEKGFAFKPLYPSVPKAIKNDKILYELLALIDAIRAGRAREKKLAEKEFLKRLYG